MSAEPNEKEKVAVKLRGDFAGGYGLLFERNSTVYCEEAEAKRLVEHAAGNYVREGKKA